MSKRRSAGNRSRRRPSRATEPRRPSWRIAYDELLHTRVCDEPTWKFLPLVLMLAFAARAAVALAGDFVMHPDEVFQYLEPAHRLVFGNGVTPWEFYYGARSWLVPGVVAVLLLLFDSVGLGAPFWYVDGVKLAFCALSLSIPVGMYYFARWHFDEMAARAALLAGAFWYELVVFAHKPMSEFLATGLLIVLLALCVHPAPNRPRTVWLIAILAVLTTAVRLQYAPLALALLGVFFLRTERKWLLTAAAATVFLAMGVFDMATWNLSAGSFGEAAGARGLFHSYLTYLQVNFAITDIWPIRHPAWAYLLWLLYAGGGLTLLCAAAALRETRRYGFLLLLIALILLFHSLQTQKEYRFIFFAIPLWLMIGADLAVRFTTNASWRRLLFGAVAAVSLAGTFELLPYQNRSYQGIELQPPERLGFIGGEDPAFAAYRYLAGAPGVAAVAHPGRHYFQTPGYYFLHRSIPFYDAFSLELVGTELPTFSASVSHVVSDSAEDVLPGYSLEKEFGDIRVWRRQDNEAPVRRWRHYVLVIDSNYARTLRRVNPDVPALPPAGGIQFADEE